jgi:hypothetical protein
MQNVALAAFLVIEYERQRDTGIAWPVGMGRVTAVTDQVAWVVGAHCNLPYLHVFGGVGRLGKNIRMPRRSLRG